MQTPENLADILDLEAIEVNLFRGVSPNDGFPRIFGGLVIAQALMAAYKTVPDRVCHSLHAYFIRPGDALGLQHGRQPRELVHRKPMAGGHLGAKGGVVDDGRKRRGHDATMGNALA